MVQLVCPACASTTRASRADSGVLCSSCGSALLRPSDSGLLDDTGGDNALISDLRQAFETSAFGFEETGTCGNVSRLAEADAFTAGRRLGDFEIVNEIGRGGMGIVYRAWQVSLRRTVALKVLPAGPSRRRLAVRRFRTEAQAVGKLHHTNVVRIHAQGEFEGHLYYAMELIQGPSLDAAIHKQHGSLSSAVRSEHFANKPRKDEAYRHIARLIAGVADGLAHAHEHGVTHRDIKPHNLLLGPDGELHITDFGLAHLTEEPHLTMSGEVMGTAAYLSPEQIRGDAAQVDNRTDIYSLGATLYEVIALRRPFKGEARDQILNSVCTTDPPAPRRWDKRIPRDLETICLRAMEKSPPRRYRSAAAMADDLRRFADGRPILSRRVSPPEIVLKWVRRHRAATAAMVATAAAIILAAGLIQHAGASRRREAHNLLETAYERLAYLNYRKPDLVADAIEQAELLGADPVELNRIKALACLGASDESDAIEHLRAVLAQTPNDARALYMLAWAQWRTGDHTVSLETFHGADLLGGPKTADAWFFRGLAAHFDRPLVAVDSYRRANALRAREDEFYPQAVLHLARAYNQQVYVTRNVDSLAEAEGNLQQLIEHGYYGAYPYYLLSITHRLAAETYEADPTASNHNLVSHHFAESLEWARKGQLEDPTDEPSVTAEAECLESMGMYEEAIAARTRAIALTESDRRQWAGHHYRWRLYYWTDQLDAALADLEACQAVSPDRRFYAHVYPALTHAEAGEMERALAEARAIPEAEGTDAAAVLWSATCLRLLGQPGDADELLSRVAEEVDYAGALVHPQTEEWVGTLHAFCMGEVGFDELTALIDDTPSSRKLRAEAHFHAGALALAEGRRTEAFGYFTGAFRSFDGELAYTFHAKIIREKMLKDSDWPPWIQPSPGDAPAGAHDQHERD